LDQETLNSVLPIIAHDPSGECCGCVVARIDRDQVRLALNEHSKGGDNTYDYRQSGDALVHKKARGTVPQSPSE